MPVFRVQGSSLLLRLLLLYFLSFYWKKKGKRKHFVFPLLPFQIPEFNSPQYSMLLFLSVFHLFIYFSTFDALPCPLLRNTNGNVSNNLHVRYGKQYLYRNLIASCSEQLRQIHKDDRKLYYWWFGVAVHSLVWTNPLVSFLRSGDVGWKNSSTR